jgi:serine protease Do
MIQPVTANLAKSFGLEDARGALISEVVAASPAEKAGFQPGDIILTFAGKKIQEMNDLPRSVAATPVGKKVKVTYLRKGNEAETSVVIDRLVDGQPGDTLGEGSAPLGMKVRELTAELARQLRTRETAGVVVVELNEEGLAAEAGILLNDIIREVNGRRISSLDDYNKALASDKKSDFVRLLVRRGDSLLYIAVKLE